MSVYVSLKSIIILITMLVSTSCNSLEAAYCNMANINGVNQNNNAPYLGFALKVGDYIFLGDAGGVHRANASLENIETVVTNENYFYDVQLGISVFRYLHYYSGRIFFLDTRSRTIYSKYIDGSDLSVHFSSNTPWHTNETQGLVSSFVIVDGVIYFQYFTGVSNLKKYIIETGSIVDLNIEHTPILSASYDERYLYFSRDFWELTSFNIDSGAVQTIMPINLNELLEVEPLTFIRHRAIVEGKVAFAVGTVSGSRIFVLNEYWYAEEIYFTNMYILPYINAINCFIYFTVMTRSRDIHLYRIRYDGNDLERIYSYLFHRSVVIPTIFINIFHEDIILMRTPPTNHRIYALVKNSDTNKFERKIVNPQIY